MVVSCRDASYVSSSCRDRVEEGKECWDIWDMVDNCDLERGT